MVLSRGVSAVGAATAHPLVNLGELELPKTTDSVSWQCSVLNPAIDRVFRDAQMPGHGIDRDPRFGLRIHIPPSERNSGRSPKLAQQQWLSTSKICESRE